MFLGAILHSGLSYIKHMLIGYGYEVANVRTVVLLREYGVIILTALVLATPVIPYLKRFFAAKGSKAARGAECVMAVLMGILFMFALSSVIAGQNNPFMYGNF